MARLASLFIILFAAAFGRASQPANSIEQSAPASEVALAGAQTWASDQGPLSMTESRDENTLPADDGICYKIRAYIFKRDDDHPPQYVRSTTCGPAQPRAKNAEWPKARVVPAD